MFVPITSDLEIQFVEIDPILPAANVYIAAADVDEDDEDFEAVLVSVAFPWMTLLRLWPSTSLLTK